MQNVYFRDKTSRLNHYIPEESRIDTLTVAMVGRPDVNLQELVQMVEGTAACQIRHSHVVCSATWL